MPYSVGLGAAAQAFLSAGFAVQFVVALIALAIILGVSSALVQDDKDKDDAPTTLPGLSLFAIYPFFRQRFDFLNRAFYETGQSVFQFHLLRHTVVVVSGESARRTFFSTRGFDLTEGFRLLSGAIPMVRGVTSDLQTRRIALIHKRLASVQKNAPLSELIPPILEDCKRKMQSWGTSGTFDPFTNVYELVFQTTVRSLSCSEIADDATVVARLKKLYDRLDGGTTPASVLLPWLPLPATISKLLATKEIYDIVVRAIDAREQSGASRNDTLQMLLDMGDEKLVIVGFIMGLLIAGARSTGTAASWMITFLGGHPDWRAKATTEVAGLLQSAAPPESCPSSPSSPSPPSPSHSSPPASPSTEFESPSLSETLAGIPLEVWETKTPVLDAVIRETLRLAQSHAALRRNLGPEVHINGKVVPSGAYVVYPFSDVHLDPELYPDPWTFDPSRTEPKTSFGYVGWGGGKTVCLGTRLAKVELKLIAAMFLLGFQHTLVDKKGKPMGSPPRPNWNDLFLCRPAGGPCYVKYERTRAAL